MSLSKPFLKETKTNSLFCLRSCPSSLCRGLTGQRGLSYLRDLSRVGARAGITLGPHFPDLLWPSGSWRGSWVMDTGTPLTNQIGA